LGEVTGVGISDDALCLIAQGELGVSEEGVVGSRDEPTSHLQNRVGTSSLDSRGQLLRSGFEFGIERFGHGDLRPEQIPTDAQSYTELNTVPTNFHDTYPHHPTTQ
jgi:hypothetical protein